MTNYVRIIIFFVFICIPFNSWADDFIVPDKAIKSMYCQGAIRARIQEILIPTSNMDCSRAPTKFNTNEWCKSTVQNARKEIAALQQNASEMEVYSDIYLHHDISTQLDLQNFFFMGQKDYRDFMSEVAKAATECASILTKTKGDACMKSRATLKWAKMDYCLKFDPLD